jgi:AraC-like DNA-binding protein
MKILALLPDDARHVLERSLTSAQRLVRAGGAEAVVSALRERRCDALVLDPVLVDSDDFDRVLRVASERSVPIMLYATLEPRAARRIVQAVEVVARELVLRGADDTPELVRHKLSALLEPSAPAMLLSRTASRFRAFPDRLQTASVGLFGRHTLPRWVNGLVKESGLARRTVDRWMHRGGISGAARLLDAARLARVWEPLVERKHPMVAVAVECGYARSRLLTAHTRRIAGVSPGELGEQFTRETFAARLADALLD